MKNKMQNLIIMVCIFSLFLSIFHVNPVYAADKKEAYTAYYSLVKELYKARDEYESFDRFKLIHVDADGIPELLAIQSPKELVNNSTYVYKLYTYYDGQICELGEFRSGVASAGGYRGTTAYIKKSGKIYETYMSSGSGEGSDVVYTLSKGKLKQKAKGDYSFVTGENEWNGKSVSSSSYSKKLNKLFNPENAVFFEEMKVDSYSAMRKKLKR